MFSFEAINSDWLATQHVLQAYGGSKKSSFGEMLRGQS